MEPTSKSFSKTASPALSKVGQTRSPGADIVLCSCLWLSRDPPVFIVFQSQLGHVLHEVGGWGVGGPRAQPQLLDNLIRGFLD